MPAEAAELPGAGPAKGDQQVNKINGENTRALHLRKDGQTPYPLIRLDSGRGTPNQAAEAASVWLRAGMLRGDAGMLEEARDRLSFLLTWQEDHGHMVKAKADEAAGDSHAPIWYRFGTSARLTTAALRDRSPAFQRLDDAMQRWWARELAFCATCFVPFGPMEGSIVSSGARPKQGWSVVRDRVFQIATGRPATAKLGKKSLAGEAQDTFAVYLAPQVAALPGGFTAALPQRPLLPGDLNLPEFHSPFVVTRYADGHVTEFPDGMEWQAHHARLGWIDYRTGEVGIDREAPAFAGEAVRYEFPVAG